MISTRNHAFRASVFLGIALLAAWFPICRPYLRIGDDFHFAGWLLEGGIPLYFHENGIWRLIGHESGNAATLANPFLPGFLSIITHGIGAMLFLIVLRHLLVSETLALLLALIFAVFPWGDTALMWACEYTYLLSTTFFLAVLCLLLRGFPLKDSWNISLCILCAALSLFAHEALFFALLISGGFVLLRGNGYPPRQHIALSLAPMVGCGIWAVFYKVFPGHMPPEHIKLHLRTLLSGVFYQYTNLEIFEPWRSGDTRNLLFFGWSWWQCAVGVFMLCALALGIRKTLSISPIKTDRTAINDRMLTFLFTLVVASTAIYALGGGFSLDSRKKYPVVPILLMFVGYGIERFAPRLRINRIAIVSVVLCGIATTWLQIGLWRYETMRLDLLVDFLRSQPRPAAVQVQWDSRIQAAWPHSNQFWGAPVEGWVLADAVALKMRLSPPVESSSPVTAVKFNVLQFRWESAN
jgi:hypothetical protein